MIRRLVCAWCGHPPEDPEVFIERYREPRLATNPWVRRTIKVWRCRCRLREWSATSAWRPY